MQELHAHALPDHGNAGALVHGPGGCRTLGLGPLSFYSERIVTEYKDGKKPLGWGDINTFTVEDSVKKLWQQTLEELKSHVAAQSGRDPKDLKAVHLMLAGATTQTVDQHWHQDSAGTPNATSVTFLSGSPATEYVDYAQRHWENMHAGAKYEYQQSCWANVTTGPEEGDQPNTRRVVDKTKIVSAGHVPAGTVIMSDTSHIHRQPASRGGPLRRTIFMGWHTKRATEAPLFSAEGWRPEVVAVTCPSPSSRKKARK